MLTTAVLDLVPPAVVAHARRTKLIAGYIAPTASLLSLPREILAAVCGYLLLLDPSSALALARAARAIYVPAIDAAIRHAHTFAQIIGTVQADQYWLTGGGGRPDPAQKRAIIAHATSLNTGHAKRPRSLDAGDAPCSVDTVLPRHLEALRANLGGYASTRNTNRWAKVFRRGLHALALRSLELDTDRIFGGDVYLVKLLESLVNLRNATKKAIFAAIPRSVTHLTLRLPVSPAAIEGLMTAPFPHLTDLRIDDFLATSPVFLDSVLAAPIEHLDIEYLEERMEKEDLAILPMILSQISATLHWVVLVVPNPDLTEVSTMAAEIYPSGKMRVADYQFCKRSLNWNLKQMRTTFSEIKLRVRS
ncbi:hypothetical protein GGF32_002523 [Allomyces javanicus]|nr:hypothetical protein GGF32_002523 [Allomyces javanicus]